MSLTTVRELAWIAAGLPRFLRHEMTSEDVGRAVSSRMARRAELFLEASAALIYRQSDSPVRRLLLWAGCEEGDLRASVAREGLEQTLTLLREKGVFFSAAELRGEVLLQRGSFQLEVSAASFDNPRLRGGIRGMTSGSTAQQIPVRYSWPFFAEEAEDELLLLQSHGLADAPIGMWMPGPPGIAGLHNLLLHARAGRPVARWFSPNQQSKRSLLTRLIDLSIRSAAKLMPRLGAGPEWVPFERAVVVAEWLSGSSRPSVLKAFASSVAEVAAAAVREGIDLSGQFAFAGGEPLSSRSREVIERSGLRVFPRYVTTESGLVAGGCGRSPGRDEMHIYGDRLAVVGSFEALAPLVITSLSMHTPKVLLNAELGDWGILARRECSCALGQAGLDLHVSSVSAPDKLAASGIKLGVAEFVSLLERVVVELGGEAEDAQLWLGEDGDGATRIRVAILPSARFSEAALGEALRERMPSLRSGALAVSMWEQSGALTVIRAAHRLSRGHKHARVVREEGSDAE